MTLSPTPQSARFGIGCPRRFGAGPRSSGPSAGSGGRSSSSSFLRCRSGLVVGGSLRRRRILRRGIGGLLGRLVVDAFAASSTSATAATSAGVSAAATSGSAPTIATISSLGGRRLLSTSGRPDHPRRTAMRSGEANLVLRRAGRSSLGRDYPRSTRAASGPARVQYPPTTRESSQQFSSEGLSSGCSVPSPPQSPMLERRRRRVHAFREKSDAPLPPAPPPRRRRRHSRRPTPSPPRLFPWSPQPSRTRRADASVLDDGASSRRASLTVRASQSAIGTRAAVDRCIRRAAAPSNPGGNDGQRTAGPSPPNSPPPPPFPFHPVALRGDLGRVDAAGTA